jgi:hypothetical protein
LLALVATLAIAHAARAEGASVVHATKAQKTKATESYRDALAAIEAKKYEEALKLLDESYNTVASPNPLLLKARALVQLGRRVEAYHQLEAAISLAQVLAKSDEKYAATAESAQKELTELKKSIALLSVKPSATVSLGTTQLAASDWSRPQPFEPGKLKVSITQAGGATTTQELDLKAGQAVELPTAPPSTQAAAKSEPAPVAPPPPTQPAGSDSVDKRTLAYVSGGIGVAGLATFGVFLYLNSASDDEHAGCALDLCPESNLDTAGAKGSYQTLAFVGLGIGVVGLATGTYLYLTSGEAPSEQPVADVSIGPDRVVLHGRF